MPYIPEREPDPSGTKEKPAGTEEKLNRKLIRLLAVFSCVLVICGAFRLICYGTELAASRKTGTELRQVYEQTEPSEEVRATSRMIRSPTPQPAPAAAVTAAESPQPAESGSLLPEDYPDNPDLKVADRFRKLRKKNPYIVGWLSVDQVEEAVAQKDNRFFLKHDAAGRKNSNGAIFLDENISLQTRPYTLILYGHNMKSGNMFGRLKKYQDHTYCNNHRIISFNSMYEEGQYAVFAVAQISTVPGTASYYDLFSLNTDCREDREKAISALEKRSVYNSVLDVRPEEQILLLVTCTSEDTDRLVVAARRLRDGEKEHSLMMKR